MTIYGFYVFDRHCECVFRRSWVHEKHRRHSNASVSTISTSVKETEQLVFGVVFALRNIVRQVSNDDSFTSYSTSKYKLHFYETPTNVRFVLLTDPGAPDMQVVLGQIYISLYVEFVAKNPLTKVTKRGLEPNVNNELFSLGLDSFVRTLPAFDR